MMDLVKQKLFPPEAKGPWGAMAEFDSPADLMHAVESLREQGYSRIEAFTPFPVHGLDEAIGHPGSKVPWIVLGGAFTGGSLGLALQAWTSAVDYPIKIAGKPFLSLPAFVPVTFELAILLSAFAAVFGMLALNGLPRLFHPTFTHTRFERVTDDKFFLAIQGDDPRFQPERATGALAGVGGKHVEVLER